MNAEAPSEPKNSTEKPEGNYMENALVSEKRSHEHYPGRPQSVVLDEQNRLVCACEGGVVLVIAFPAAEIVRFRYSVNGEFADDFSYALREGFGTSLIIPDLAEDAAGWVIKTSALTLRLCRDSLRVDAFDDEGRPILLDEKGFHWEDFHQFGGEIVKMSKRVTSCERYFGLGDKACPGNLRGKRLQLWGSDTYGYGADADPLYKNIPFYVGIREGRAYGVFFDNTFHSHFDFAHERNDVSSFWAQGGEMNYYLIAGPDPMDVVRRYAGITGVHELPPLWAMGYHQCKWSYRTEEEFRGIASQFRKLEIPCDALYLDIDYMDGFRCFTWNRETFPDPARMISDLKEAGFRTVVIIDPGIKIDPEYDVWREGKEGDLFCRRADGPLMKGSVWPGECHFPDFTKPEVREWWGGLFRDLLQSEGVAGFWNDMNEPAVFETGTFPLDVRHDYDGHPCSHRKAHNVYGMQMVRASEQGIRRLNGGNRPFLITRSGYAGVQRYSSGWTGDNVASWEHLRIANRQCQQLSVSGLSFVGSDIGGFIGQPDPELYIRWLAMGVFHPLCRTHSSGDHGDQEPWSFGKETTDLARKFIELRYRFLPYLYTTFWQHFTDGSPFLRPLAFLAPDEDGALDSTEAFGVGDHLVVCPVSQAGKDGRSFYLPRGTWYDFWNDNPEYGGEEIWATAPLDRIPLFVRAGSVLPLDRPRQSTSEPLADTRELHVYHGEGERVSVLYEDRGEGHDYRQGESLVRRFRVSADTGLLVLTQEREGDYDPGYRRFQIVFHGLPGAHPEVHCDEAPASVTNVGRTSIVAVGPEFERVEVRFQ